MKGKQEVLKRMTTTTMMTASSPRHNHVGIISIFISLQRTAFILEQEEVGDRRKFIWAGGSGIRRSREAFLPLFYLVFVFCRMGACKYVCDLLDVSLLV